MRKTSKAYQLKPMSEVTIAYSKKDKKWYPIDNPKELFIEGKGRIKIDEWEQKQIKPLSDPYTAKEIKEVYEKYGYCVALGMIKGWSNQSFFADGSIGLRCIKHEIDNMMVMGQLYDDYTDIVQEVGDKFIEGLKNNDFVIEGDVTKGWLRYKKESVGQIGIYNSIHLHPLQHIEHYIGMSFLANRISPSLNPITFDKMLVKLFVSKYRLPDNDYSLSDDMLSKYVSVHDRIEHLTTKKIADGFEKIFKFEERLNA